MALDLVDQKILHYLQEDGRITNSELAQRIGLTPTPTMERVRRLERDGYILGYRAVVNPKKIGRGQNVFIKVSLKEHRKEMIEAFLAVIKKMPEVQACYHTTGESDFMLRVAVRDIEDYEDFIMHKMTKAPAFARIESTIVLSVPKEELILSINEHE
jgi:Lrp/AsnC family leucine-responsive transcriptional regulator